MFNFLKTDTVAKVQKKMTTSQNQIKTAIDSANSIFQKAIEKVKAARESLVKMAEQLLEQKPILTAEIEKIDAKIKGLELERTAINGNFSVIDDQITNIEAKKAELDALVKKLEEFTVTL